MQYSPTRIYTFRAGSLPEALAQIRRTLGPDATILPPSRETIAGPRGTEGVVVRALPPDGAEAAAAPLRCAGTAHLPSSRWPSCATWSPVREREHPPPAAELEDYRRKLQSELGRALREPSLVERLACPLVAGEARHRWRSLLAERLAAVGIGPDVCQGWLARWEDAWEAARGSAGRICPQEIAPEETLAAEETTWSRVQAVLTDVVAAELPVGGPLELGEGAPLVVLVAGPTGVGKTATIASLAARFTRQGCRVGLVAADPQHRAAVDPLRAYAGMWGLPFESAASAPALATARQKLAGCELVLVDTAGFSLRDPARWAELAELRTAAQPSELLLVLSAHAHPRFLRQAVEALQPLEPTGLVLTKLDEAAACGPLLEWLSTCPLPLRYTTAGQKVPDDLQVAAAHVLADELLRRAFADGGWPIPTADRTDAQAPRRQAMAIHPPAAASAGGR